MFLTKEEERTLKGEYGPALQLAMQVLATYGDAVDAKRLIKITSVHAFTDVLSDRKGKYRIMANEKVKVKTTNHIAELPDEWKDLGISSKVHERQAKADMLCEQMGIINSHTCTPHLVGNIPTCHEHIAWIESSAQVYANSVLGAMTNKEGSQSAIAAAITGKIPEFGYHLNENRRGTILVNIQTSLENSQSYAALGYYVGKIACLEVPAFNGFTKTPNLEEYKFLSAGLATSGGTRLFHAIGLTPEAETMEKAFQGQRPEDVISFTKDELEETYESLCSIRDGNVDIVVLGCPHASIHQIKEIVDLLNGNKIHKDVKFWVLTSFAQKSLATRMGYTRMIENAGGKILCDSCPLDTTSHIFTLSAKNIDVYVTDSAKQAHYARQMIKKDVIFSTTKACVKAAINGRFSA